MGAWISVPLIPIVVGVWIICALFNLTVTLGGLGRNLGRFWLTLFCLSGPIGSLWVILSVLIDQ